MSKKQMITQCKENMKVYSLAHGWGTILYIRTDLIDVRFTNGEVHGFYGDGRFSSDGPRVLFFTKPTVDGGDEPIFAPQLTAKDIILTKKRSNGAFGIAVVREETQFQVSLVFVSDGLEVSTQSAHRGARDPNRVTIDKSEYRFFKIADDSDNEIVF